MTADETAPTPPERDERLPEAAYARKLGLAILSVLQDKGVLTEKDVNTILLAVNRSVSAGHDRAGQEPTPEQGAVPEIDMEL